MRERAARLETLGLAVSAAVAAAFLGAHAFVNVLRGLSSGDDGFFALASKMVAYGAGYAIPRSSDVIVPFDYAISTGPTMIVPLALAIDLVGVRDRLPGAVALTMFAALLAAALVIVGRRVSVSGAAAFAAMLLVLLAVGTRETRLFGVFVGEAVMLALIVLAVLVLAPATGRASAFVGGLLLALALLTKLIAGFAVAGVAVAFVFLEVRERGRTRAALERPLLLALGAAAPIVAFEVAHVAAVGLDGYIQSWIDTSRYSGSLGTPAESALALVGLMIRTVDFAYIDALVLVVACVAVGAALAWPPRATSTPRAESSAGFVGRALVLTTGALVVQWAYLVLRYAVYDRYLFLGVGLIFLALALLVLLVPAGRRLVPVIAIAVATTVADPAAVAYPTDVGPANALHAERLAVVAALDASPALPYAADFWPTIYQFVAIRPHAGTWAYGRDAGRLAGQRFVAVEDVLLATADADFVSAARSACEPLTPGAKRLRAYDCGDSFWRMYLDTRPLSATPPAGLDPAQRTRGGQCNVDYIDRDPPRRVDVAVGRAAPVPIFGWAWDDARLVAPESVVLALADEAGALHWFVPAQSEARADLGNHFGVPSSTGFGFKVAASFAGVPPGRYRLSALVVGAGTVLECDTRLVIGVT